MALVSAGQIVATKYELVRFLGRGSMGEVWVARHRGLGEEVALKMLLPSTSEDAVEDPETAAARFRFEARIAARLSRKTRHIVRVTDHGDDGGLPYLVMELLEGQTLDKRLLSWGTLPPAEVAAIVAQIARALEEAHAEGVMHRDLKPANIFLAKDEDGRLLVKLLDFGIARATRALTTGSIRVTAHGIVFGTPGYMSPEQAFAPQVDYRCDLWALATVAYEALAGELPVPGARCEELLANLHDGRIVPVHARNAHLPQGLAAFFDRAFAAAAEWRFADASELARAFEQAIDESRATGAGPTAPVPTMPLQTAPMPNAPPRRPMPSPRPPRPRGAWSRLVLAGPAVAIAALAMTLGWWRTPAASQAAPRSPSSTTDPAPELAGAMPGMASAVLPQPAVPPQEDAPSAPPPPPPPPELPDASAPLRNSPPRVLERSRPPAKDAPSAPVRATPPPAPPSAPAPLATVDRSAVF
jgi:eukaryotic-like serine/threonine-protein kinase